jgi:hypothetical protein
MTQYIAFVMTNGGVLLVGIFSTYEKAEEAASMLYQSKKQTSQYAFLRSVIKEVVTNQYNPTLVS